MDSRERVFRALERTGPDRLPIFQQLLPGAKLKYGERLDELLRRYPSDFSDAGYYGDTEYGPAAGVGHADAWGAVWTRVSDDYKGLVTVHPLADWSALERYRFPDPRQVGDFSRVIETVRTNPGRRYLLVDGDTLFQRMFYLRGFENLLIDLAERRPEVFVLRDRILTFLLRRVEVWLGYGVDGLFFRDDWGTQQELMIRPALWREIFKPAYGRLFAAVRAGGKHVFFHSDGVIAEIIPDLIEIGVDALNAQLPCMDAARLAREFGGRLCLVAGADRQRVLPFGTPAEVEAHCLALADGFGRENGGYIGGGEIAADVPLANAEAMLRTFAGYTYPRA
jgi:uroporphyrinogen decarboxylase